MKSLKIIVLVAVVSAIFASLTPQQNPTKEKDKNDQTIVKVTFKKEKKGIKVPQQG